MLFYRSANVLLSLNYCFYSTCFNYCLILPLLLLFLLFSILYGKSNDNMIDYIFLCTDRTLQDFYIDYICIIEPQTNFIRVNMMI